MLYSLDVLYSCDYFHGIACENENILLKCDTGLKITVVAANYGRTDGTTCPHASNKGSMSNTKCISNQISAFNSLCNGKNSCNVPVENSKFGDPCHGTYKYTGIFLNNK
jgi:hypothetical protein